MEQKQCLNRDTYSWIWEWRIILSVNLIMLNCVLIAKSFIGGYVYYGESPWSELRSADTCKFSTLGSQCSTRELRHKAIGSKQCGKVPRHGNRRNIRFVIEVEYLSMISRQNTLGATVHSNGNGTCILQRYVTKYQLPWFCHGKITEESHDKRCRRWRNIFRWDVWEDRTKTRKRMVQSDGDNHAPKLPTKNYN